tara:strand:+ start:1447 stop:2862 length:1416 start_codon:yes stop_codon:yes gene_type:complete
MGTLTANPIATTYKSLVFTDKTSSGVGDIYYTDSSTDADVKLTTLTTALTFTGKITATAGIELDNNIIYNSEGTTTLTLDTSENLTIAGDLTISGGNITNAITTDALLTAAAGVKLGNNVLYASDGGTAITLDTSDNVTITGDLTVNGGDANIVGAEGGNASLKLKGDEGDDAGDEWELLVNQSNQRLIIGNDIASAGTYVSMLEIVPHATASSSYVSCPGQIRTTGLSSTSGTTSISVASGGAVTLSGALSLSGNVTFSGARDIIFPDSDGLEIKDSGGSTYMAFITDTIAVSQPTTFTGKVLCSGNTGLTAGTGITAATGETYNSWVERYGNMIKTSIYIDIATLRANGDAKVIGKDGGTANCHLGQVTTAVCGAIVGGRMTCIEAPTGHSSIDDIDLHFDNESTHAEAGSLSSSTALITNGEAWTAGMTKAFGTVVTADNYLYFITGENATDTEYTGGKFLIELWGTV